MSLNIKNKRSGFGNREIVREGFRHPGYIGSGTGDIKNKRSGLGNRRIVRPGFKASDIKARNIDFDKIRALDIQQFGTKVRLSDETLDELFKTRIGDPRDTEWLTEKDRMVSIMKINDPSLTSDEIERRLEINKPLGRDQRTIVSRQNIGFSSLSTRKKLVEIQEEIDAGRGESRTQQAVLIGHLTRITADQHYLQSLTRKDMLNIAKTYDRLNVPSNHEEIGLKRLVDIDYYAKNAGMINLFLIGRYIKTGGQDLNRPVPNLVPDSKQSHVTLRTMINSMSKSLTRGHTRKFLDLHSGGLINSEQALRLYHSLSPNNVSLNDDSIRIMNNTTVDATRRIQVPGSIPLTVANVEKTLGVSTAPDPSIATTIVESLVPTEVAPSLVSTVVAPRRTSTGTATGTSTTRSGTNDSRRSSTGSTTAF